MILLLFTPERDFAAVLLYDCLLFTGHCLVHLRSTEPYVRTEPNVRTHNTKSRILLTLILRNLIHPSTPVNHITTTEIWLEFPIYMLPDLYGSTHGPGLSIDNPPDVGDIHMLTFATRYSNACWPFPRCRYLPITR